MRYRSARIVPGAKRAFSSELDEESETPPSGDTPSWGLWTARVGVAEEGGTTPGTLDSIVYLE